MQKNVVDIKLAELDIRMLCSYEYTKKLCSDFETVTDEPVLTLSVSGDDIELERRELDFEASALGYCEGIALYRAIAERIPSYGGFVFHGAAVNINGSGVIFTARSGVGKTTHISLLLKNYPDNVRIINGDKPILRRTDGKWRVFSTPWAGKEGMKTNSFADIKAIVLLERSEENFIDEISSKEAFNAILHQVYLPGDPVARMETFELVDDMAKNVRFYRLGCNISSEAAETSYNMLK